MSDHDWQAPGGAPAPSSTSHGPDSPYNAPPATGVPPQPSGGALGFDGGAPPLPPPLPGVPGAWAPPPKPGLLPLRPLSFGTLLWAPFRALRENPAATFGSGLVVQLVTAIATVAVVVPFTIWIFGRVEGAATTEDFDAILSGGVGAFLLVMLVPVALSIVAAAFLQGVMVVDVASGTLGERLGFGALWRRAAKRIGPLLGWTALVTLAVLLVVAAFVAVIVVGALTSAAALAVAIIVTLLAGLGVIVLAAWLGTKLSVVPSAIVLEHAGIATAVRRSWRLTNGYFWRTLGTLLLVAVILNVAAQIVVQPISFVGTILAVIIDPTGAGAGITISIITTVVTLILSLVIGAITSVVQAGLIAVIYVDLRMRHEGLDLELQRTIELREAGQPVGDPFAAPTPPEAAATWS